MHASQKSVFGLHEPERLKSILDDMTEEQYAAEIEV